MWKENSNLSLKQAEGIYKSVLTEFASIKSRYSGLGSILRRNIKDGDRGSLQQLAEDLLPLANEDVVKEQFLDTFYFQGTLRYKIGELYMQMLEYIDNFRTSRLERFWS